jgi:hypothetical protein
MKKELEHSIKESIEGFEMPYDAQAWTRLEKSLDALHPTSKIKSYRHVIIGASAILSILVIGYFFTKNSAKKNTNSVIHQSTDTRLESTHSPKTAPTTQGIKVSEKTSHTNTKEDNLTIQQNNENVNTLNINTPKETAIALNVTTQSKNQELNKPTKSEISLNSKFTIPTVSDICLGEVLTINNPNDLGFQIHLNNEKVTYIKGKQSINFKPTQEGIYTINYVVNGTNQSEVFFTVLAAPSADFIVDERNNFEHGIPTIEFNALGFGSSYSWSIEGQNGFENGKEVEAHFFKKGNYSIALVVQGFNGCQSKETKTIQINEDYNLLAVNTFDPNTADSKRNNFMPYALTQRETAFSLIIIDPKDGSVIFESDDTTNPWKGIDSRTNQLVNAGTYIWKVILKSPLKGEKSSYQGTITRL